MSLDVISYSRGSKVAAAAMSGVDSISVEGTTLNIKTKNGEELKMVFPTPKDGVDGVNGKDGINGKDGKPGKDGINGKDGKDGTDGFSPTATVTKSGNVSILTVTDKNGTTSVQIHDGKDGVGGECGTGYTPVKGVDYWTEEDKAEIKQYIDAELLGGES